MMLADKVLIVTGAGQGIGRAIALAAGQAGARVVVADIAEAPDGQAMASKVCDEIVAAGGNAIESRKDVSDPAAAERIVAAALDRWGRIDVVVNNAGIIRTAEFPEPTPDIFDAQIQVNLYGAFNLAHAAAPHFKAQEGGAFIHMTSSVGLIGSPHLPGYAASKFGIVGLSRALSFDMAKFKVRSNCIAPSAATQMTMSAADSPASRAYVERMKEVARPEQVAPLALFLASDAAAGVTGQIFGTRGDTIFLYNQPRPVRIAHRGSGWTAESIANDVIPGWRGALVPHETTSDVIALPGIRPVRPETAR